MYKVFIDNKVILFTKEWKKSLKTQDFVLFNTLDSGGFDFVKCRDDLPIGCLLIVLTDSPEETIRSVFCDYDFVEAAGGLVKRKNKYLFIERHGLWDIPKGKMEKNELPEVTAVREIEEECGIRVPKIKKLIGITFHTYDYKGKPTLKKNWWYSLDYDGPKTTAPQSEEDITKAVWLSKKEWDVVRENTYASIREVLDLTKKG
ncbi:MAG TPA: NUDIX domain-containing protein [Fluviicola sp.]|nr:NUDIX domain-containing protein [Fluviicola sp.]